MPVHDWSRVPAGIFHDFHNSWLVEIRNVLNKGLLPKDHYALTEQVAGEIGPDVLTLSSNSYRPPASTYGNGNGNIREDAELANGSGVAVATQPLQMRVSALAEKHEQLRTQKKLAIRHVSNDRLVAVIEVVSSGNKSSTGAMEAFLDKAVAVLDQGIHLLVLDLQPPTVRDPHGIHGAIWAKLGEAAYEAPAGLSLTLAAYAAGRPIAAYVEPVAVGDALIDMPLFLEPKRYVPTPLDATYRHAWSGVPQRWRDEVAPPLA